MNWTLITGGSKRLGAQLCLDLAEKGYPILVHYRESKEEAQSVVKECIDKGVAAEAVYGDLSTPESVEIFIELIKNRYIIKNLINNVGNYLIKSALETSPTEWQSIFRSNFLAPMMLSQAFQSSLRSLKGNIINIGTSGLHHHQANTTQPAYKIFKMALWDLTKSLAKELVHDHVRVNMISPGYLANAVDLPSDTTSLPMQRPAELNEISRVVLFLLDEASDYITGQNIEVSGGTGL